MVVIEVPGVGKLLFGWPVDIDGLTDPQRKRLELLTEQDARKRWGETEVSEAIHHGFSVVEQPQ